MKINVATCQFPIGSNIRSNLQHIKQQMISVQEQEAKTVHFPEACLSGYARADFPSYKNFNWGLLEKCTCKVLDLARKLHIWVILGSTHRLSGQNKPHNSLYIINDKGELVDRYGKMFCAGDETCSTSDLDHYTPGNYFCVFEIEGVRCGTLICHDYRYPELYREYKRKGVQLMFHSFHAGHIDVERFRDMQNYVGFDNHQFNPETTIPGITQPAAMHVAAANNYMWISCPNSSARESCWSSFLVRPDGIITGQVKQHTTGILLSTVDTEEKFYDSTAAWRDRPMNGIFHSGKVVQDLRTDERTRL
jgi:predicted amidohydrolase